jgi:histidinol-phosphate/aromatic aminotransferase/cobyric acid decarboxylase-like protein/GNAT superfamily N-acetyltransferase
MATDNVPTADQPENLFIEPSMRRLTVHLPTPRDREKIYRLRHDVYATELRQHAENARQMLRDPLDEFNEYIVASVGFEIAGFVSITPPGHSRYSIDKYLRREELPFACDDGLYEVRLLTVAERFRNTPVASLLMYAALRWVESRGGTRMVAIGREEVLPLYRKIGFLTNGRNVKCGAVTFALMSTPILRACEHALRHIRLLRKLASLVDWRLDVPFLEPPRCRHGGAFFEAIGTSFDYLDRHRRIINADVLDAWYPPAPEVLAKLQEHLAWIVRTSPPTHCDGMLQAIAEARGVPAECLVPGGGSSALVFLAFRQWLTSASRVLILDPTYGEYAHVLEQVIGCRTDRLMLHPADGFKLDLARLERLKRGYDLVVIVNPNNPTGRHVHRGDLEALLRRAPPTTRFWIDEAYVDYVGAEESLERYAAGSENVVVSKSMSKVYALSGLRAAYLCAPAAIARQLLSLTPPWAVSLPAQIAAVAALGNPQYYRERYQETHRLRDQLAIDLETMGITVVCSGSANFLLCRLPADGSDVALLLERCRSRGLFLRDVSSMTMQVESHLFRVAVKDEETNRRMLRILGKVLGR